MSHSEPCCGNGGKQITCPWKCQKVIATFIANMLEFLVEVKIMILKNVCCAVL